MLETGTFLFISDHCHVIENVSNYDSQRLRLSNIHNSGVMAFPKDGWQEITQPGLGAPSVSSTLSGLPRAKLSQGMIRIPF